MPVCWRFSKANYASDGLPSFLLSADTRHPEPVQKALFRSCDTKPSPPDLSRLTSFRLFPLGPNQTSRSQPNSPLSFSSNPVTQLRFQLPPILPTPTFSRNRHYSYLQAKPPSHSNAANSTPTKHAVAAQASYFTSALTSSHFILHFLLS